MQNQQTHVKIGDVEAAKRDTGSYQAAAQCFGNFPFSPPAKKLLQVNGVEV